jgi:hypothetical protein
LTTFPVTVTTCSNTDLCSSEALTIEQQKVYTEVARRYLKLARKMIRAYTEQLSKRGGPCAVSVEICQSTYAKRVYELTLLLRKARRLLRNTTNFTSKLPYTSTTCCGETIKL